MLSTKMLALGSPAGEAASGAEVGRFAITAVRLAESLPNTCAGRYYADQLLRAAVRLR